MNQSTQGPALIDYKALSESLISETRIKPETFAMPEVAQFFGVHPQTSRDWARRGILPPPAISVGRTVRWSRAQLEKVLTDGVTAPSRAPWQAECA